MAVNLDWEKKYAIECNVIGVDEAGRGPLVGGVFAAAVYLPLEVAEEVIEGSWSMINDSKALSAKKREILAATIKSTPKCIWSIASASSQEIDELNILRATHLAMRRATEQVIAQLRTNAIVSARPSQVIVDGLPVKNLPCPSQNIIKGDAKSLFIAAASILAKTARDEDCLRLEALYPGYGIAKHKGYPTKDHFAALQNLGPCPEHRRSFRPVAETLKTQFP